MVRPSPVRAADGVSLQSRRMLGQQVKLVTDSLSEPESDFGVQLHPHISLIVVEIIVGATEPAAAAVVIDEAVIAGAVTGGGVGGSVGGVTAASDRISMAGGVAASFFVGWKTDHLRRSWQLDQL
jgi:hypothetical protein